MNDLSGLSWDVKPTNTNANGNGNTNGNGINRMATQSPFLRLTPTPSSFPRQGTPLSTQSSGRNTPLSGSIQNAKPAADSFSNLLASSTAKKTASISLQERQKQLLAEKAKQATAAQQNGSHTDDAKFWEALGGKSSASKPDIASNTNPFSNSNNHIQTTDDENDLLAGFNSTAPVDRSSYFPPPRTGSAALNQHDLRDSSLPRQAMLRSPPNIMPTSPPQATFDDDDDDPFGLKEIGQKSNTSRDQIIQNNGDTDDDILGMLGKPVDATATNRDRPSETFAESSSDDSDVGPVNDEGHDAALAQLLDLGFSTELSREALAQTSTGSDVQAAIGWLLNRAHDESKSRSRTPASFESDGEPRGRQSRPLHAEQNERTNTSIPTWMRAEAGQQRHGSRSPALVEGDITQYATDIGSTLYKSANKLWRTGQKKVQKVMVEYREQDRDGSQPKWMKGGRDEESLPRSQARESEKASRPPQQRTDFTDEALLLESRDEHVPRVPHNRNMVERPADVLAQPPQRWHTPPVNEELTSRNQPNPQRRASPAQLPQQPPPRPADRLRKQLVEEETAQAYVSPARRRKAQPESQPPPQPAEPSKQEPPSQPQQAEPELDIFSSDFATSSASPRPQTTTSAPTLLSNPSAIARKSTPTSNISRPPASRTTRPVPTLSPNVLSTLQTHRVSGTAAFKRGDYATAQTYYSTALSALPPTHPIAIILYTNRSLTYLKNGEPKAAISDADAALTAIGSARGEGEYITLESGEEKQMKEFYGKALMRKAEALEHLEKWSDAAGVWRDAVAAGVGGAVSIQGRNRCEKAAGIVPSSSNNAPTAATFSSAATPSQSQSRSPSAPIPTPASRKTPLPTRPKPTPTLASTGADSEAVIRLRAANAALATASDEAFALNDVVSDRLTAWKTGKEGNLRALLASLDTVLWSEAGWNKVGMGDLVLPGKVKIIYMKAIGRVHPDKLSQTATTEHKMISAAVFATLNEAWDRFKRENGL